MCVCQGNYKYRTNFYLPVFTRNIGERRGVVIYNKLIIFRLGLIDTFFIIHYFVEELY